ncbi:hypothetical protein RRG08_054925 [Elysia crispata]|uniref:Uncharacterized protein n=1 Tax=Elysia crispata TaxID=231223 RepID=A0AAE0YTC7_9GAST|nr:hypothetical protein RRG08_054925 [Elysia crispata]
METKAATSNLNPHDVDPDDPFDLKKSQDLEDADGIHSTSCSSSDYEMSDADNFCPNSEIDSDVEIPFQGILQCYKPPQTVQNKSNRVEISHHEAQDPQEWQDPQEIVKGRKLWAKSARKERRIIMNDMRLFGRLLLEVQKVAHDDNVTGADLLDRVNFEHLSKAITNLTSNEHGHLKAGLKLAIGYISKKSIKDTIPAIEKLVEIRAECGIAENNPFLFPNTESSLDHVIGSTSIKSVVDKLVDKLKSPHLMTADKFRHRAATLFAQINLP